MNRGERQLLLSERTSLQELLKRAPQGDVLGTRSLESRLAAVQTLLDQSPADTRMPARACVTFRGKPVVGSYGIFAEFGMKATQAFTDTVSKVAASLEGPLANMGPVPNKAQNQLLITSTAVGSFGFQLEEHRDEALLIDDGSAVGEALAATQTLLEATAGDDDSLAEAAAGMEPRAIAAARAFLTVLADNEAVCAVSVGGKSFGFTDVGQVQRAVSRLPNIWPEDLPTIPPGPGDTRQDPPGEPEYPPQSGQSNAISGVNISSPLPNASISGNVSPPTLTAPHPIERTRPSTHGEQSAKQFPAERAIPRDPDPDPAFRQQVHSVPNVPSFPCLSEGPDHLNKVIGILAEWAEMQIRVRTSLTGGSDADRSVSRFPPSI